MNEGWSGEMGGARRPVMTAVRARQLARRELSDRLERLLVETGGNVAEMARRLGKDRSTVRYHLRRFGMLEEPSSSREDPAEPAQQADDAHVTPD